MDITGLFRARVLETEHFPTTGHIHVHVYGLTVEETYREAQILTPFGGLPNMGIQAVPPVGAEGYVLFERAQQSLCIWMGAILGSTEGEVFKEEFKNGYGNPVEADSPEALVIKTQYQRGDSHDMEGKTNKVENIIKLDRTAMVLAKVKDVDKYEYQKKSYSLEDQAVNLVSLADAEVKVKFKFDDNSKSNTLSLTKDGVNISYDTDGGSMRAAVTEKAIELVSGGTQIKITKDGDCEVTVADGKKIKLNGSDSTATLYEGFQNFVNNVFMNHQHGSSCGGTIGKVIASPNTSSAKSKSVKLT